MVSTNYTIKTDGGSFQRRVFEVELSAYFGAHHSPFDEFGCMLFDDWNEQEWARFDQFMVNCVQYYLENGLVSYELKNLNIRKVMNDTSAEFFEWMEGKELPVNGERVDYKELYQLFLNEYEDFNKWLTQRIFNKWLSNYYEFRGVNYDNVSSNGKRYYEIVSGGREGDEEQEEDLPF